MNAKQATNNNQQTESTTNNTQQATSQQTKDIKQQQAIKNKQQLTPMCLGRRQQQQQQQQKREEEEEEEQGIWLVRTRGVFASSYLQFYAVLLVEHNRCLKHSRKITCLDFGVWFAGCCLLLVLRSLLTIAVVIVC